MLYQFEINYVIDSSKFIADFMVKYDVVGILKMNKGYWTQVSDVAHRGTKPKWLSLRLKLSKMISNIKI